MNDADNKKLEEIIVWFGGAETRVSAKDFFRITWLISKIKEQDREIERLRRVFKGVCNEAGERQEKLEKAEAELADCEKAFKVAVRYSKWDLSGGAEKEKV